MTKEEDLKDAAISISKVYKNGGGILYFSNKAGNLLVSMI
jgi:hypothetical protein